MPLKKPTRGERNNNPGNIRKTAIAWRGEVPGIDKEFETFSTPEMGIRALAKLLRHYVEEGYNTPRKIINRYAPQVENDTNAYLASVCKRTKREPDQEINFKNVFVLRDFITAIIIHENGKCIYSGAIIARGINSI